MPQELHDKDGNRILLFSTSIPGLSILPGPGESIHEVADDDFRAHLDNVKATAKDLRRDFAAELDVLKSENSQLKQDMADLKANGGRPAKP